MKRPPTRDEWNSFIKHRRTLRYADIAEITGHRVRTLKVYAYRDQMPKPDSNGVYILPRPDLADWVTGDSRPGAGARTDIYKTLDLNDDGS